MFVRINVLISFAIVLNSSNTMPTCIGFGFFCHSDQVILICRVPFPVRPQGMSIDGLDQPVRGDTEVTVNCRVRRVKPAAYIYWRKGAAGPLQTGHSYTMSNYDGTFRLQSIYKVSFSRKDHGTKLHCLVTRRNNRTDVWKTVDREVSVMCEYNMMSTCRTSITIIIICEYHMVNSR